MVVEVGGRGGFTVKSYMVLEEVLREATGLSSGDDRVYGDIWKSSAPSRLAALSWKLLWDQIPIKTNLSYS